MVPEDVTSVLIQVAGLEHSVRFRVCSGTLEVYAYGEARSARVVGFSIEELCGKVRELLTDIILQKIRNALADSDLSPSENPQSPGVHNSERWVEA